jgi:hypothetical protein
MTSYKRNGKKWTVTEILSLEREHELLNLTIQEMAIRHQRTETAILYKLESEGFIENWTEAKGFDLENYKNIINNNLNDVVNPEVNMSQISDMVNEIINTLSSNKTTEETFIEE